MNSRQKPAHQRVRNPAYRQAFERLEEALERNAPADYSQQLELIGRQLFGDLWRNRPRNGTGDSPK